MSDIEWTDETWNPLRGCRRVSPGCEHCYAERQAARPILSGPGKPYEGLVRIRRASMFGNPLGPQWTGATAGPDRLDEPLRWRKPRKVFVCSMSDLFYEGHSDEQIAHVFAIMGSCPQHTFQVLTKRAERMAAWFARRNDNGGAETWAAEWTARIRGVNGWGGDAPGWPLPNVWIGVSVEDQQRASERLPHLLRVPAAVRWVSAEPLLGPLVLGLLGTMPHDISPRYAPVCERIHWVVTGGESGPGARPCDLAWIRALRDECQQAQVPVFVKQLGARPTWGSGDAPGQRGPARIACINEPSKLCWSPKWCVEAGHCRDGASLKGKGGDPSEWPADLKVREFPC